MKSFSEKLLRGFGVPGPQAPQPFSRAPDQTGLQGILQRLAQEPLNANLHLQFAIAASTMGRRHLAYAELKTAQYLGVDGNEIDNLLVAFREELPDPISMYHNLYFRLATLSAEIIERGGGTDLSILDVGGGEGVLASFIPDARYCLAEPTVNCISGTALPFADRSFDYVVCCHVLEHVPLDQRHVFLDQMLSKSQRGLILNTPFDVEGAELQAVHEIFIEITGAQWAKEHLDCIFPKLQDIRDYADSRGLQLSVKPNGTHTTSMAFVFIDYFAAKAQCFDDLKKINAFYNSNYTNILDSAQYPNSYLIYLGRPETKSSLMPQTFAGS